MSSAQSCSHHVPKTSFRENLTQAVLHTTSTLDFGALQKIIIEMQNCRIKRFTGNYSAYAVEKAKQLEQQQKTYESQQADISRTEEYIRRNIAGQKTKQAKRIRKK